MPKTIETLVEDIQALLMGGLDTIPEEFVLEFGHSVANTMKDRLKPRKVEARGLRMSSIGKPCVRQLWHEQHDYDKLEEIGPDTKLKFLYGDLIEEFVLFLAELAGHRVEGRQDTLQIAGITGHRDAIIDGVLVDVKSASTYSFQKFRTHLTRDNDPFGYVSQLQSYLHASQPDDRVLDKSRGAFLVIDKTLGHVCLDFHDYDPTFNFEEFYEQRKEAVARDNPPDRYFDPVPEGKSGNLKLGVNCSYCAAKFVCHPNLRTFIYSTGPVYLTKVVREPNVPEA